MASDTVENPRMPVWVDDTHMDPAWIRKHTNLPCIQCTVQDISNETRRAKRARDGATLKLTVELENNQQSVSLVVKQVPTQGRALSRQLGLAREALFYSELAADVETKNNQHHNQSTKRSKIIPEVLYSYGDLSSGEKVVIMEDLSQTSIDSGAFFGPGNPNNWKRDLPAMVARAGPHPPSAAHVAKVTFVELAQVHAAFWCRTDLLDDKYQFLRGHQWLQGKGKESWEASQSLVQQFWKTCLEREANGNSPSLKWDPTVRAAVEAAVQGISWEAQLERLHVNGRWTVVHGDCWPGNFMWKIRSDTDSNDEKDSIKLLDWEMCGCGSGPQDLGQYILSNMDPAVRRDCEHDLIRAYFEELQRCGVKNVDWEYCWNEYKLGGLERWLWFLVYFVGQEGMLDWSQFFHDQIASFMHDHKITDADITQPRP